MKYQYDKIMFQIKYRWSIIAIIVGGLIISLVFIKDLQTNFSFGDFLPSGLDDVVFYHKYVDEFGSNEQSIIIAVGNNESIFKMDFLQELSKLTHDLNEISFIKSVYTIVNYERFINTPLGYIPYTLVHINDSSRLLSDSVKVMQDKNIIGRLISSDAKVCGVYIQAKANLNTNEKQAFIDVLEKKLDLCSFIHKHIGGEIYTEVKYLKMLKFETIRAIIFSTIVVVLILWLIFRSWQGVIIPVSIVIISLTYLYGYLAMINLSVGVLETLFPPLILVVGMSDLIHLYSKYIDDYRFFNSRGKALKCAVKEVRLTTFLTSLTTLIGFLTFYSSNINPVKYFGLNAAVGIIITYVITFSFGISVISFAKVPLLVNKLQNNKWQILLSRLFHIVIKYPNKVLMSFCIISLIAFMGVSQISFNNYQLNQISEKTKLRKDYVFIEKYLCGLRYFELFIVTNGDHRLSELEILNKLDELHLFLDQEMKISTLASPINLIKETNRAIHGGKDEFFSIPQNNSDLMQCITDLKKYNKDFPLKLVNKDWTKGRFSGTLLDIGRIKVGEKLARINIWIRQNMNSSEIDFRHTGISFLNDKRDQQMSRNMFQNLSLAFIIIAIVIFFVFRDLKLVVIAIIPNIFPLIIVGAILGFTGIDLDASISVIFTIGYVIAVDDTIHFLSKFKLEREKGKNVNKSIELAFNSTGKAMIQSSMVLFWGFLILLASPFRETYYNGLLVSMIVLFALLADLLMLPALLSKFVKK